MTSWLTSGLPRQFFVMKENRRCSIRFHLLVPGGKWQTEISSPVSSASFCNSSFHNRTRHSGVVGPYQDRHDRAVCASLAPAGGRDKKPSGPVGAETRQAEETVTFLVHA